MCLDRTLNFLGHLIDLGVIQPLSMKVEAIQQISRPTLRQLCKFLDMVNFYRRFVPNCVDKLLALTVLLKAQKKKNSQISKLKTRYLLNWSRRN